MSVLPLIRRPLSALALAYAPWPFVFRFPAAMPSFAKGPIVAQAVALPVTPSVVPTIVLPEAVRGVVMTYLMEPPPPGLGDQIATGKQLLALVLLRCGALMAARLWLLRRANGCCTLACRCATRKPRRCMPSSSSTGGCASVYTVAALAVF